MKFFGKIKKWWLNHRPTKRRLIQVYAALLTNANIKGFFTGKIYTGGTKYACVPGLNCYSCPGAVGACPLGSLQNALAQSGTRAPFYVFGILILFGLLLGRTICGFLCPVGLGQELLYKIKTPKLKKNRYTRIFSYLKYVILAVFVVAIPLIYGLMDPTLGGPVPGFCKYICPAGTFGGAVGLLINPNNADMFGMLGPLFTWKFCLLVAIMVACVFIFRAFCRFLCPLGAIYGFFNRIALLGVKLDKNACTDCGLCVSHCKMDVKRVGDHECINCGECMTVCPAKAISWKGSKLFLHKNAVEAAAAAEIPQPSEERPLNFANQAETVSDAQAGLQTQTQAAECFVQTDSKRRKRRGRNFWLQAAAWGVALVVLVGALVYYNFIHTEAQPIKTGNQIGDLAPDFILPAYLKGEGEQFEVYEQRGKILVLNFWTTYCTPCIQEIPHFEEIANKYYDSVTVAIVHGTDIVVKSVEEEIRKKGWGEYTAWFLQDTDEALQLTGEEGEGTTVRDAYRSLGGKQSWPMTVILDEEGYIYFVRQGSLTYEVLTAQVERILAHLPPEGMDENWRNN